MDSLLEITLTANRERYPTIDIRQGQFAVDGR